MPNQTINNNNITKFKFELITPVTPVKAFLLFQTQQLNK